MTKKLKFVSERIDNDRKGENAGYQNFLLFPKCFQKPPFSRLLIVRIVWPRPGGSECQTHDLVVASSIPGGGDFSFRRIFSPLTSAEACEKSSWGLWKEKLC